LSSEAGPGPRPQQSRAARGDPNLAAPPGDPDQPAPASPRTEPQRRIRWRPSILLVLLLGFGGLTVISAATVALIGYDIARRNTYELVAAAVRTAMTDNRESFDTLFGRAENAVRYLAGAIERGDLDPRDSGFADLLEGMTAAEPQLGFIAFVDPRQRVIGMSRASSGPHRAGSPLAIWPDLARAVEEGETTDHFSWRGVSYVPSFGTSFVVVTAPVKRGGRYLGITVAGVPIASISSRGGARLDPESVDFVLRGQGEVLGHPALAGGTRGLSPDRPVPRAGDIGDPVITAFFRGVGEAAGPPLASDELLGRDLEVNGTRYILLYYEMQRYDRIPWRIGRYFPAARATEILNRLQYALLASVAAVAVSLVVAVLLSLMLAGGIGRLADAAQRVAKLDFEKAAPLPGSMLAELDRASRAFNAMRAGLIWFETYVPRSLVKRLLRMGGTGLAPVERELTVLFTDVVGFSQVAQRLRPPRLAAFLNRHFQILASEIEAESGTVDKYIGDSVMAFWGAPVANEEHALHACRAALAMGDKLKVENARRRRKGLNPVRIRIGIHSGRAVAGNIGAPGRINYTLIGDTVNLAQRLEQLARKFDDGADAVILASSATIAWIGDQVPYRSLGAFDVAGFPEPVEVYRLG